MKGGLLLNKFLKGAGFYLLLLIIIVTIVEFAGTPTETVKELNFSQVYNRREHIRNTLCRFNFSRRYYKRFKRKIYILYACRGNE